MTPCDALATAGIALLAVRYWTVIGPFPPGLDGAQWIALGRGFRGSGRASEGYYPPLVPAFAAVANALTDNPLAATRALAVAAFLTLSLAVWGVARAGLGPCWALLIAAVLIPASALAEPVMYGGYPQHVALAANIVALWALCTYLSSGNEALLVVVAIGASLSALSHHIYFPLFLSSGIVAFALSSTILPPGMRRERWPRLIGVLLPSCAIGSVIGNRMLAAGYTAPLDATSQSIADAWTYATREAPLLWLAVVVAGISGLAVTSRARSEPFWLLAASLFAPAALLATVTGQARLLPPVLIGAGFGIGFAASTTERRKKSLRSSLVFGITVLAAMLLVPAQQAASAFASFYRLADASMLAAVGAIEADAQAGAVAVRADRRGWPIGWWIEALQDAPVYVGSDDKWLAYTDERTRANQARSLFDSTLAPEELRARASAMGVRYLVVRKWDWIGWERWTEDVTIPLSAIHDDDRYVVFRFEP